MRSTAPWLLLAIAALGIGCTLDTTPGGGALGKSDGAIGSLDGSTGPDKDGGAGAGGSDEAGKGGDDEGDEEAGAGGEEAGTGGDTGAGGTDAPSPCADPCSDETPVCLEAAGECVQCAGDEDCSDPALPACDGDEHACVACTEDAHCSGDAPHCDPASRACVQCTEDAHCGGDTPHCSPASSLCVGCTGNEHCGGETPACDPETLTCVACVTNADCPADGKPECVDHVCSRCTSSAACTGRERAALCDLTAGSSTAGKCVECTVADESACSGLVCDPEARRCTDRPKGSKNTCKPCIADSECVADHRCIALQFGDQTRPNAYCMKRLATGCARPFMSAPIRRTSRSGAAAEDYCGIDELKTTCEAIAGLVADAECPGGTDAACTHEGSLCRTVNGGANRCTYACEAAAQCPPAFVCGTSSGYCGGP